MIPCQASTRLARETNTASTWSDLIGPCATPDQRYWLSRPGALTVGLRSLGKLELTVLRERFLQPCPDERAVMRLPARAPARVREIQMTVNGVVCVVARSVLSRQGWAGPWQALRQLGGRPLADLLYDDPLVTRSVFQMAHLRSPHPLARLSDRHLEASPYWRHQSYWSRRSVFWRNGQPLLVAECFLPSFWELLSVKASPKV